MVSKQRTIGGAKACRLHDLVHEFCVKKAKEENFLHVLHGRNDRFILTGPSNPLRVCDQNGRNLMIWELMLEFPNYWRNKFHPSCNSKPLKLQTFLLRGNNADYLLPKTIWNIKTLRHLWTTYSYAGFIFPVENLEVCPGLIHLDTLSLAIDPSSQSLQKILTKLPNIRRLRCTMTTSREEPTRIAGGIPLFDYFSELQSLALHSFHGYGFKFPLNLKKLTLSYIEQPWSEISTIGKLPKLEVLKLLDGSFVGEEWEMKEGEFPSLRVLKLRGLRDFCSWTASFDNFPRLEKLVVHSCLMLEEVPSCLGECPALEVIEVSGCSESVASSVKQIQQEQIDMGNEVLKILIENCVDAWSSSEEDEESSP
ncbi:putative late blight resistance protein homolog R1B-16 [Coffea arabica]|uniref:Late blight resistance protein homolog R1B-16 n=1 Tax=Coffea arabica TaxID=13443 RepID=A0ABM4V368_COFAR